MMRSNVHTHTTWCDGKNTPREMAEVALALGFTDLGFSSHGPAPFDPTCPGVADENAYCRNIAALKAEYSDRLSILCGIEQDSALPVDRARYDYIIGSTHYITAPDSTRHSVDSTPDNLRGLLGGMFDGNGDHMAETFYRQTAECARRDKPDILGHYDLITKFNRGNAIFDENSAAYKRAALEHLDDIANILAGYGGLIEVNTGAMGRGLRDVPYPADFLLRHLAQKRARVIITTDCHSADTLDTGYEVALACLCEAGFDSMTVLHNGRFVDVKL